MALFTTIPIVCQNICWLTFTTAYAEHTSKKSIWKQEEKQQMTDKEIAKYIWSEEKKKEQRAAMQRSNKSF